jgi:hypothetical protein
MNERPFVSRMSGQRYATAAEAGELQQVIVDGIIYHVEDLPRRIHQFHEMRGRLDAIFTAAQKSMR